MLTSSTNFDASPPRKEPFEEAKESDGNKQGEQEKETITDIWKLYKSASYVRLPENLFLAKKSILSVVVELHREMKLPIEALYMADSLLNRFLISSKEQQEWGE